MTVIEYFISGILCIFQNQMECHFFFFQERWGMSLSSFPIQTTYSMASKMNGTGSFLGRRGEAEREKDPSSLCPLPASLTSHCCLPHPLVLEPTILRTMQQSIADWGYVPFLTPLWSMYHTEIKPQDHLIHPVVSKKQSIRHDNFAPRSPFVTLDQGLIFLRNAFLSSN